MSRYIDAELFEKELADYYGNDSPITTAWFNHFISKIPTADVAPVVHAHWEYEVSRGSKRSIRFYYRCTNCGRVVIFHSDELCSRDDKYVQKAYPYCHCGAKMERKENEDGKNDA